MKGGMSVAEQSRGTDEPTRLLARFQGRRTVIDALIVTLLLAVVPIFVGDFYLRLLAGYLGLAVMAVGLDLVWGYAGVLSMGQAAYFGAAAYVTAIGLERLAWAPLAAIFAGVVVAVVLAAITSALVFYSRVGTFFVAIITLALAVLAEQIVNQFSTVTGGFNGIVVSAFTATDVRALYIVSASVAAVALISAAVVATSDFGRLLVAMRDDEERLRFLGIRTPFVKTVVFCIGALFAAVGGVLFTVDTQFVSPDILGFVLSTQVVIWTVIGGRYSVVGPFLGAIGLSVFEQSLGGVLLGYWQLALGVVLIGVVISLPDGIYPTLRRWVSRSSHERFRVQGATERPGVTPPSSLRVTGVTKRYDSLYAVRDVTLRLNSGEIVCLVGPNGAGKSTLIDCITGQDTPDYGEVFLGDRRLDGSAPEVIARQGIGRTFQTTRVFDTLSVFENLFLAAAAGRFAPSDFFRRSREAHVPSHVASFIDASQLGDRLQQAPAKLSHGERQWLELCMAMATNAQIVLLDEPTAGLTKAERSVVGETLRDLAANTGLGLLLVEHDLEFVSELAEFVLVLHQGQAIAFGSVADVATNSVVRDVYLGATT